MPCHTDTDAPVTNRPTAANSAHTYASRPCPSGWRASAGRLLRLSAISKNTSFPVSAQEWAASATIEADPDNTAATVLAAAMAALAASATRTVRVLSPDSAASATRSRSSGWFTIVHSVSCLTGRAPEHVAALEHLGQHRGAAYPAGVTCAPVHVCSWPTLRIRWRAAVMLRPDHVDLAAAVSHPHQLHQIGPHRVEFGGVDGPARPVRVDPVPEQQLVAIDIADACDHRLVHQERTNRPLRLGDSRPGPRRVGIAPKRVWAKSSEHRVDLRFVEHVACCRAPQIGAEVSADHPHAHLADRQPPRH